MATLNVNKKAFDPTIKNHRKDYHHLMTNPSKVNLSEWKLEPPFSSVMDMMKTKISTYYISKEFK